MNNKHYDHRSMDIHWGPSCIGWGLLDCLPHTGHEEEPSSCLLILPLLQHSHLHHVEADAKTKGRIFIRNLKVLPPIWPLLSGSHFSLAFPVVPFPHQRESGVGPETTFWLCCSSLLYFLGWLFCRFRKLVVSQASTLHSKWYLLASSGQLEMDN